MDETKMLSDVMGLINEMWIYIVAIWATTQLFGGAVPQIPNRLFAVLTAIVYGIGAHLSGYMTGGWFVVILVKTPIAAMAAQQVHERLFNVVKKDGPIAVSNIIATIKGVGNGKVIDPPV